MPQRDPQKVTEAARISSSWLGWSHKPSVTEVRRAALLAWEDYLTSVKCMDIRNMDLSDIDSDHMKKLTSIVTYRVWMYNLTPASQVGGILATVKSERLWLVNMKLSEAHTRALVTAMRDRVERVVLVHVTLDIEALCEYQGRGRCRVLKVVWWNTVSRHRARLRQWAAQAGWTVTRDDKWELVMVRK